MCMILCAALLFLGLDRRMARFLSGTIKLFSSSVYDTRGLRSAMMY